MFKACPTPFSHLGEKIPIIFRKHEPMLLLHHYALYWPHFCNYWSHIYHWVHTIKLSQSIVPSRKANSSFSGRQAITSLLCMVFLFPLTVKMWACLDKCRTKSSVACMSHKLLAHWHNNNQDTLDITRVASWLAKVMSGSLLIIFLTLVSGSWLACFPTPRTNPLDESTNGQRYVIIAIVCPDQTEGYWKWIDAKSTKVLKTYSRTLHTPSSHIQVLWLSEWPFAVH